MLSVNVSCGDVHHHVRIPSTESGPPTQPQKSWELLQDAIAFSTGIPAAFQEVFGLCNSSIGVGGSSISAIRAGHGSVSSGSTGLVTLSREHIISGIDLQRAVYSLQGGTVLSLEVRVVSDASSLTRCTNMFKAHQNEKVARESADMKSILVAAVGAGGGDEGAANNSGGNTHQQTSGQSSSRSINHTPQRRTTVETTSSSAPGTTAAMHQYTPITMHASPRSLSPLDQLAPTTQPTTQQQQEISPSRQRVLEATDYVNRLQTAQQTRASPRRTPGGGTGY